MRRFGYGGNDQPIPRDEPIAFVFNELDPSAKGWTRVGAAQPTSNSFRGYAESPTGVTSAGIWRSNGGSAVRRERSAGFVVVDFESGPSKVGLDSSRNLGFGFKLRACDNGGAPTGAAGLEVMLYSDGFRVQDEGDAAAGLKAEVDIADMASKVLHFRIQVEGLLSASFRGSLWYRVRDVNTVDEKWVLAWEGILKSQAIGVGGVMEWGNFIGDTAAVIHWRAMGATSGSWHSGIDNLQEQFGDSVERIVGLRWGKVLPADRRYPCDALNVPTNRLEVGFLRGGGFAAASDEAVIPPRYEFALENAFPASSPSPRRRWRSTSTDEFVVAWDWEDYENGSNDERWHGNALALVVMGAAAPRLWQLQTFDLGAWQTIGTLDLDLAEGAGLSWDRTGVAVIPAVGTNTIDRYIHEGELVGGYFADGTGDASRIVRNSGGYWTGDAAKQRVVLELEDERTTVTGSTGALIAPGGVAVFDAYGDGVYGRLRVRAVAGQEAPGDAYQAGVIAVGRVVGIGAEPGWGWRRVVETSRETSRRRDQLLEVRSVGPARELVTYEWPDGVIVRELNSLAGSKSEAMVAGASAPIGTREDAHSVIAQLLAGRLDQGRVPCVAIPQLPALGDTLTDPYRFVYGRVRTDTIGITGLFGTEGVDETVRVDSLTVEALK